MTTTDNVLCPDPYGCWAHAAKVWKSQRDLTMAMLKHVQDEYDVALALGGYLDDLLPADTDRRLLIEDIVRQWRRLTPEQQKSYKQEDGGTPVGEFAYKYVESLSDEAFAGQQPQEYGPERAVAVRDAWWRQHVTTLRDLAEGKQIEFQFVLIEPGDKLAVRAAADEERIRFNLPRGACVMEIARPGGEVELYGCRTWELKKRLHYKATPRGALLYSPRWDMP